MINTLKARFADIPADLVLQLCCLDLAELFPLTQRAATAGTLEEFLAQLPAP